MLTGWIHHTVYIGIMVHLAMSMQSPIFLLAAIMEVSSSTRVLPADTSSQPST